MSAPTIFLVALAVVVLVLIGLCYTSRGTTFERLGAPLTVQACIFSLESGSQNWSNVLTLIGTLRSRGFHVALAVSVPRSHMEAQAPAETLQAMDAIVAGDEVTRPKPAADLYLEAARRLRVHPTRCLAFDESPAGVEAAQAAGMLTAALGRAWFGALAPDWVLRDLSAFDHREIELPKALAPAKAQGEEPPLAAIARLLPPDNPLHKCLMGQQGPDAAFGV